MATLCLIHGNWHDGSCWEPLLPFLRTRGHDAVTPDLPFERPNTSYQQRARPALEALAGVTGSVVVVGHSRGSAEAGIVAAQRDADLLVYLCPRLAEFAAPDGAPSVYRSGFPYPPRRDDGTVVWEPDAAIAAMYPRIDPITAHELARRLYPAASPTGAYPLAAPPDLRTALVYAAEDELFTPDWERFAARELLDVEPVEIPGGHFPMIENPDALADALDRLITGRQ